MADVELYETVLSDTLYTKIAEHFYMNALAAKEVVLADKSGSYDKPDHRLAQFETKHQKEHKPKKGEAKYTYIKVITKVDDLTGEVVTNRDKLPVRAFFNSKNADLKNFLQFFLLQLCKEYGTFYPSMKGKYTPKVAFEKTFSEYVEKKLPGSVARFMFTIGNTIRVDTMTGETVIAPEMAVAKEMEGFWGTQTTRPTEHINIIVSAYLRFCKVVAVFLANYLIEMAATITVEDLLVILRNLNTLQRAEGISAGSTNNVITGCLNNAIFDEVSAYVKARRPVKAKKGEENVDDIVLDDDLTEEITGEKPVAPKTASKPAAAKGKGRAKPKASAKSGAKAGAKSGTKKAVVSTNDDEFEDAANGDLDDLDELD